MKKTFQKILANLLPNIYSYGIANLFFAIILFICIISAYCTSYVTFVNEHSYFLKDSIFLNLLIVFIIILAAYILKKIPCIQTLNQKMENDYIFFKKCKNTLLVIIFIMGFLWVTATQYIPGADQYSIQNAVYALHLKDYHMFYDGGYIAKYQNQLGILLFSYIYSLIFGSHNYVVMQMINALAVSLIYKQLAETGALFGQKRIEQLLTVTTGIFFIPLIMYSSFIYGNVLGLLFSLLAVKYEILFFKDGKKRYIAYSSIFILISISMKSNYIIFMIGMLIYATAEIIANKKWKNTILIIAIIAAYLFQANVPSMLITQMTGIELGDGVSPLSYIAMGLQDSDRAPGWYNGYNSSTYKDADYDKQLQNEMAIESIEESIEKFKADKKYAGEFFIKKIASMYTEPSFQGFWICQVRKSAVIIPNWTYALINVIGSGKTLNYLNLIQFATYAGVILYCIFCRKNSACMHTLIFPMIFIGGFIFHLFWEAKSQYTLSYFVLLFPYAVSGYSAVFSRIQPKEVCKKNIDLGAVTVFVIVIIAILSQKNILDVLTTDEDQDGYLNFIEEQSIGHITVVEDGLYNIVTSDSNMVLNAIDTASDSWKVMLLKQDFHNCGLVNISTYQGSTRFLFRESDMYLEYGSTTEKNTHSINVKASSVTSAKQKWVLKEAGNDYFYIMYGTKEALTYDLSSREVYVSEYTGDTNQMWRVYQN